MKMFSTQKIDYISILVSALLSLESTEGKLSQPSVNLLPIMDLAKPRVNETYLIHNLTSGDFMDFF